MKTGLRYMRLIVFFDLPVVTPADRRAAALFRKYLLKSGFLMVQESVYSKLAISDRVAEGVVGRLRQNAPSRGLIQILKVTERQYSSMINVTGKVCAQDILEDTESLVVL